MGERGLLRVSVAYCLYLKPYYTHKLQNKLLMRQSGKFEHQILINLFFRCSFLRALLGALKYLWMQQQEI